jgi:hypothetical protein
MSCFADRGVDLLAERKLAHRHLLAAVGRLEPCGGRAAEGVHVVLDHDQIAGLVAETDDVALAHPVARDVHLATVDVDVP